MNRFAHLSYFLALVIVAVMIAGCAGGIRLIPLSVKIQNADRKLEKAEGMQIRSDTKEHKREDVAEQKKLYDEALGLYLDIINIDPTGKYVLRSHFAVAEVYKRRQEWEEATEHYQAIVDRAPAGYLGGRAKSSIADVRKNRKLLQEKLRLYQNRRLLEDDESQAIAAESAYEVAKVYQTLNNYAEAIRHYEKVVEEFPEHQLAPQAQFQVGNLYFYEVYDYSDNGGWGAYVKLIEEFPDSYEASEAIDLLKKAADILTEIQHDQDDIQKYTNKKAVEYEKTGKYIVPSERYVMGYSERVVQDFQNIAAGWVQMRNFPFAIAAYRSLATKLSYKKFAAADARYRIADLYQKDGEYLRAIDAFADLFENSPESTWRDQGVYQQAVCYRAIREFAKAHEGFKAYMSINKDGKYYREAEQILRQYELDQDGDGYMFYIEQEAGTSDQDPKDYPGVEKSQIGT
jgi:tetratricopeptide (TPR) repeat protein